MPKKENKVLTDAELQKKDLAHVRQMLAAQQSESTELTTGRNGEYYNYLQRRKEIRELERYYDGHEPVVVDPEIEDADSELFNSKLINNLYTREERAMLMGKGLFWWDLVQVDGVPFIRHLARKYNEEVELAKQNKVVHASVIKKNDRGELEVRQPIANVEESTPDELYSYMAKNGVSANYMAHMMTILMIEGKNKIEVPSVAHMTSADLQLDMSEESPVRQYIDKQIAIAQGDSEQAKTVRRALNNIAYREMTRDPNMKQYADLLRELNAKGDTKGREILQRKYPEYHKRYTALLEKTNLINATEGAMQDLCNNMSDEMFQVTGVKEVKVAFSQAHEQTEKSTWSIGKRIRNFFARMFGGGKTQKELQEKTWSRDTEKEARQNRVKEAEAEKVKERVLNPVELFYRVDRLERIERDKQDSYRVQAELFTDAKIEARHHAPVESFTLQTEGAAEAIYAITHEVYDDMETVRNSSRLSFDVLEARLRGHLGKAQRLTQLHSALKEIDSVSDVIGATLEQRKVDLDRDSTINRDVNGTLKELAKRAETREEFELGFRARRALKGGLITTEGIYNYWGERGNGGERATVHEHMSALTSALIRERSMLHVAKESLLGMQVDATLSYVGDNPENQAARMINEAAGRKESILSLEEMEKRKLLGEDDLKSLQEKYKALDEMIANYDRAINAFSKKGYYETTDSKVIAVQDDYYTDFLKQNMQGISFNESFRVVKDIQALTRQAVKGHYQTVIDDYRLKQVDDAEITKRINVEIAAANVCAEYARDKAGYIDFENESPQMQRKYKDFLEIKERLPKYQPEGYEDFRGVLRDWREGYDKEPRQQLAHYMDTKEQTILTNISMNYGSTGVMEVADLFVHNQDGDLTNEDYLRGLQNTREQYQNLARPAKDFALACEDIYHAVTEMTRPNVEPEMFIAGFQRIQNLEINTSWDPAQLYVDDEIQYREEYKTINEAFIEQNNLLTPEELEEYKELNLRFSEMIKIYQNSEAAKEEKDKCVEFFRGGYKDALTRFRKLTMTAVMRQKEFEPLSGVLQLLGSETAFYNVNKKTELNEKGADLSFDRMLEKVPDQELHTTASRAFRNAMCMSKLCNELISRIPGRAAAADAEKWERENGHLKFKDFEAVREILESMKDKVGLTDFQKQEQFDYEKEKVKAQTHMKDLLDNQPNRLEQLGTITLGELEAYVAFEKAYEDSGKVIAFAENAMAKMREKVQLAEAMTNYVNAVEQITNCAGVFKEENLVTRLYGAYMQLTSLKKFSEDFHLTENEDSRHEMVNGLINESGLKVEAERQEYLSCKEQIGHVIQELEAQDDPKFPEGLDMSELEKTWLRFCQLTHKCVNAVPSYKNCGIMISDEDMNQIYQPQNADERKQVVGPMVQKLEAAYHDRYTELRSAAALYENKYWDICLDCKNRMFYMDPLEEATGKELRAYENARKALADYKKEESVNQFMEVEDKIEVEKSDAFQKARENFLAKERTKRILQVQESIAGLEKEIAQTQAKLQQITGFDISKQGKQEAATLQYTKLFKNVNEDYRKYRETCDTVDALRQKEPDKLQKKFNSMLENQGRKNEIKQHDMKAMLKQREAYLIKNAMGAIFGVKDEQGHFLREPDPAFARTAECLNEDAFRKLTSVEQIVKLVGVRNAKEDKKQDVGADLKEYIRKDHLIERNNMVNGQKLENKTFFIKGEKEGELEYHDRYATNPVRKLFLDVAKHVTEQLEVDRSARLDYFSNELKKAAKMNLPQEGTAREFVNLLELAEQKSRITKELEVIMEKDVKEYRADKVQEMEEQLTQQKRDSEAAPIVAG